MAKVCQVTGKRPITGNNVSHANNKTKRRFQINPGVLSIGSSLVLTGLNMLMLSYAMRGIPVGTAYAIWTGLGAVGITLLGIVFFKDPANASRLAFMALIVVGVIGLKLTSGPA